MGTKAIVDPIQHRQEAPPEEQGAVEVPPIVEELRAALEAGDSDTLRDVIVEAAPLLYAMQIDGGFRCLAEIGRRDLKKESIKNLASSGGTSADRIRDLARSLAEAAPSTFNIMTNFPLPAPGEKCPMCRRPEEGRDWSGFDDVPGSSAS